MVRSYCIRFAFCTDTIESGGFGMLLCSALLNQLICVFCAATERLVDGTRILNIASITAENSGQKA